ncbi:MAG: PorP/SprF family type IX secretion system membrane protein [Saprospiraceae bacterium]
MAKHLTKLTVLLLILLGSLTALMAQDAVFSQFYAAPLLLNPAFAGTSRAPSLAINHRSQNVGFDNGGIPYQTYAVSYGQLIEPLRSGVGLSVFADNAGVGTVSTYAATAYYSYQVRIDRNQSIRIGMSAGVRQQQIDWDRLKFLDQANSITGFVDLSGNDNPTMEVPPGQTTVLVPDFGAGMLYASKVAYAGFTLDHLTTPDDRILVTGPEGFYTGYPMRLSVHAGTQINLSPNTAKGGKFVTPNVLYTRQGPFEQLNAGAYVGFDQLFGGAWFRHSFGNPDAAIAVIGVEWDMYKFGYSYDFTVSDLSSESSGTHEISLQLNFDKAWWIKKKRQSERNNDCLQLFR